MGRINLYDLAVISGDNENVLHNIFNTLPMGIIEIKDNNAKVVRSNRSYRDFIERFFGVGLSDLKYSFSDSGVRKGTEFMNQIKECCETGNRVFFDETMPDGSMVHSSDFTVSNLTLKGTVFVDTFFIWNCAKNSLFTR